MHTLDEVLDKVEFTYSGLRQTARLVMAAAATTRLDRQHPLAIILVGGPSSGKTSLLMPLVRAQKGSVLASSAIRVDEFTPASLVSHSANKNEETLKKIDLLPRLAGKVVICKEMAPIFTGKEEELTKKFGVLASVLDGEGYVSSSGNHGQRGYSEPIVFTLVGAVTPEILRRRVFDCLSAVGPRFNFWEVPPREIVAGKWRGSGSERQSIEKECHRAMLSHLERIFSEIPPGSVSMNGIEVSFEMKSYLSAAACLMAFSRSRAIVDREETGEVIEQSISQESPERAYRYVEQIAMGSALLEGRMELGVPDLRLAVGLALGSAHPSRRALLKVFMDSARPRTVQDLSVRLSLDQDTAMKRARLLEACGVLEKANYDGTTSWNLRPAFSDLRRAVAEPSGASGEVVETSVLADQQALLN